MTERSEVGTTELRALFESGAVYADRWTPQIRAALDVADPLTTAVVEALNQGRSVVLSGNAGDGKSHLAQRALDQVIPRRCLEVTASQPIPRPVSAGSLIFIRDASGLSDEQVIESIAAAKAAAVPILITINEGPLASLAQRADNEYFRQIRDILHERAVGGTVPDPPDTLILSLSGRQLTRADFVQGVLQRLLPVVSPCTTCGKSRGCPRVVGARMLRKSARARTRIELLLRLLTDGGQHLSAREIWVFLIDLFFGWRCPPGGTEADQLPGYFWMRIFEGDSRLAVQISEQFDPIMIPLAREDVALWQGRFDQVDIDGPYPGSSPDTMSSHLDEEAGLRGFTSAKRCHFFFGKKLDAEGTLERRSLAPQFGRLLQQAMTEPRPVIRDLVGLINKYRLSLETENELWISRHHGFAAHRRPAGLGAAAKLPIEKLNVLVPFKFDAQEHTDAGFFPTKLYLHWTGSEQLFTVDFDTWERLKHHRTLTVDREQETLDFAIDLFMAQADVPAVDDPEILIYDHRRREKTILRIRPEERRIEVLR